MEQKEESKKEFFLFRPVQFLSHWRPFPPYELICYILMFAGATLFAWATMFADYKLKFSIEIIKPVLLTIATLYCGFFAALIWNDITDKDIDIIVHPARAVPSGHISPKKFFAIALVFSALTFLFAVLTSPWCLIIVGITALFVAFHNKYLKKIIKIPAYSEIFTPVQWLAVPFSDSSQSLLHCQQPEISTFQFPCLAISQFTAFNSYRCSCFVYLRISLMMHMTSQRGFMMLMVTVRLG